MRHSFDTLAAARRQQQLAFDDAEFFGKAGHRAVGTIKLCAARRSRLMATKLELAGRAAMGCGLQRRGAICCRGGLQLTVHSDRRSSTGMAGAAFAAPATQRGAEII